MTMLRGFLALPVSAHEESGTGAGISPRGASGGAGSPGHRASGRGGTGPEPGGADRPARGALDRLLQMPKRLPHLLSGVGDVFSELDMDPAKDGLLGS